VDLAPQLQSDEFLRLQAAAEAVFNVAIGYEYEVSEALSVLAGVRSDMSYFDESLNDVAGIKPTVSSWDIYHFSGGVTFNRKNSSLSLGLLLSTGSNNSYEQSGSFDPEDPDLVAGSTTITKATYSNIGLLLGYTFYFKKFSLSENPGADD
jgi:long-subunit fatty acid transport protein